MDTRIRSRWFPWIVLSLAAALVIPAALLGMLESWLEYRESPPACYGIGPGCSPTIASAGWLIAFLWLFSWPWAAITVLLTEFFWEKVALVRSVIALLALAAAAAVTLLLSGAVAVQALT